MGNQSGAIDFSAEAAAERREYLAQQQAREAAAQRANAQRNQAEEAFQAEQRRLNRAR